MRIRTSFKRLLLTALVVSAAALMLPSLASAASANDAFYKYTGTTPLASIAPGTPLKTRNIPYSILGFATPLRATQILYRATDAQGRPTANVTSVVQPACFLCLNREKVISYQSFYDSLNPEDQPSVQIAGGVSLTGIIPQIEIVLFAPFLLKGYSIVISDTQGQTANFAAGPEYGTNTLDSIRAAIKSPQVDLSSNAKVAMMGYSGGAIATEWAAELAPTYAPELNKNLIGAAYGGVLVHPGHNLYYVEGSSIWAGVMPMAIIGVARSYGIDLQPYLSENGKVIYEKLKNASIINVLGQYPGLKWTDLAKPEYNKPEKIPAYVAAANKVIMGTGGIPRIPSLVGQGTGGELEGTPGTGTYGKGDGVMIAGDVRSLLRKQCAAGAKVQYNEYGGSHITSALEWLPQAIDWTFDRFGLFGSLTVPSNCSSIKPGNSLAPLVVAP
ncbi:MAG: lipase family protein [Solirubrobacterales bacterium]